MEGEKSEGNTYLTSEHYRGSNTEETNLRFSFVLFLEKGFSRLIVRPGLRINRVDSIYK